MSKNLLFLALLGLSIPAYAQEELTMGSLATELQTSLSTLKPGRMKTTVLADLSVALSNPKRFAGNGDTINSYANWEQQYLEFYRTSLNRSTLPTLPQLRERIASRIANGQVPLLVLNYEYDKLRADAVTQKLITIDSVNAQVYDGPDLTRSPYEQGRIFATAVPIENYSGSYSLYVGPEFTFGNLPTQEVWLDSGDGIGWQLQPMGSTKTSLWNNNEATYRASSSSPSSASSAAADVTGVVEQQQVWVYANGAYATTAVHRAQAASIAPDMILGLAASRLWGQNDRARGVGWVRWGAGNTSGKFRRPLIFVEGIDFADKRAGTQCGNFAPGSTGPVSAAAFQAANCGGVSNQGQGVFRNGEAGWNELVDYNPEYKALEKMPVLRAQLEQAGYDIVYLDFTKGADLIQNNAMLLVELLDYVNNPANRTANAEEAIVMGASMGGQVARFGLAWMEQQGLCHNSKLYVSMDSPHRGANIPLGIQYLLRRLLDVSNDVQDKVDNLLKPASKQMLVYHFDDSQAMSLRNEWQTWQNSPGSFPSMLRRVAAANGSKTAATQLGMWPGMDMIHLQRLNPINTYIVGQGEAYALPGTTVGGRSNTVFRYRRPYSITWNYRTVSSAAPAYDTAPGSMYRTAGMVREAKNIFSKGPDWNTFMPTTSVLGVSAAGSIYSPNLNYNVSTIDPTKPDRSKYDFDAYYAPDGNEPHVQITNGQGSAYGNPSYTSNNSGWILDELAASRHDLASNLSTIYNFGNAYRRLLPSVQINSGGQLYINNGYLPVNGGTAATQGLPSVGNFDMYTSSCGTKVQLNTGGIFAVGVNSTYTATLSMANNSLLDLRSGGRTDVNVGSVLRIKAGATLVVRAGSTLNVYGQVIVESGAFLCVENPASIVVASGGQYIVNPGVNAYANPALGLGTLACAPVPVSCTSSSVALTTTTSNVSACAATYRFTASGTNVGSNYQWSIDGYPVTSYNGRTYVDVRLDAYDPDVDIAVTVSSLCPSVAPVSTSRYVNKFISPKCSGQAREAVVAQRISLYPNPSDSYLLITSKDPARTAVAASGEDAKPSPSYDFQTFRVELYDGRGKQISAKQTQAGELKLDTSKIPNGLYHIKVIQGDEVLQENISIQH
ncbi:T9SS type A sorting domain-containing protein [Hymenobacter aquaticus]|uniref:T9SS type A sorting domain-containing protein n=1 Tax=Hymenobacter aquaticus TaxID=1867101 RepID=A0A4Z0PVM4_9BACT|nr:T9SS type A sorting domain-containing protein [Hymenobacter aquaticus]TGE21316.1 T9SS type A sorting domain-containing protein [Hymenobacter aquaticus]